MDGRGRLAQPLTWLARWRARLPSVGAAGKRPRVRRDVVGQARVPANADLPPSRLARWLRRSTRMILKARPPRGVGITAATLVMVAGLGYGVVRGDHVTTIIDTFKDLRDGAANAAGFRIVSLALSGHQHVSREEILAIALKLTQAEYLTGLHGSPPILLIDDVMGGLDLKRRSGFLPLLKCKRVFPVRNQEVAFARGDSDRPIVIHYVELGPAIRGRSDFYVPSRCGHTL